MLQFIFIKKIHNVYEELKHLCIIFKNSYKKFHQLKIKINSQCFIYNKKNLKFLLKKLQS